ncbi:MAG: carboxypeptidase regulatory-like domain-containing protein [Alphaproteobacteria bacterium]|nr:carboxypeptidase regulatory-like domain-containing protein [Alphaproteobacteria bacterium]MCB9698589.1 carboxypeptidase regulatory-like domain-containing protein [Alphaproteobacteria bacterium]
MDEWYGWEAPLPPPEATAAGVLEGRVVDDAGLPLGGAHVTLTPSGVEATTDDDGHWVSPRLLPGTYAVVAAADGWVAARSEPVDVDGDEVVDAGVLALDRPAVLDGFLRLTVFGPDGFPAVGAEVLVEGPDSATVVADATGRVTVGPLQAAPYHLTVDVPGRRVVPREADVEMPALGGADLALTLAGRGEPDDHTIGSRICGYCHVDIATSWQGTAHAEATGPVVGAPAAAFDAGLVLPLGTASARFGRDAGEPVILLTDASGATDLWRVAGLLGGERRGAVPWADRDGASWPLPVAWTAPDPRYPGVVDGGWVAGDPTGWFGAGDRFAYTTTPSPDRSAEAACFACHVTGTTLSVGTDGRVTMQGVSSPSQRWDEGTVACEACHGAGETHSAGPLSQKLGSITVPEDLGPDRANDVCGRCHAAVIGEEGLPFPWTATHGLLRPGDALADLGTSAYQTWPSGSASVPGAAVDELRASLHGEGGWNATCTDCHDPHGSANTADLRLSVDDDTLCQSCHLDLTFHRDPVLAAAHSGHVDRCVDCHMPATAARLAFDPVTGAGDLASHTFDAAPPQVTVDAFDAAGAQVLPVGSFVPDTCLACHVWSEVVTGAFDGPVGDPAQRATHVELQAAWEVLFP